MYVASTTLTSPQWQNSNVNQGDVAKSVAERKTQPGENIIVNGNATLIRSLLDAELLDELHLLRASRPGGNGA